MSALQSGAPGTESETKIPQVGVQGKRYEDVQDRQTAKENPGRRKQSRGKPVKMVGRKKVS